MVEPCGRVQRELAPNFSRTREPFAEQSVRDRRGREDAGSGFLGAGRRQLRRYFQRVADDLMIRAATT